MGDLVEFVVCDDEKSFRNRVIAVINKVYMKNNDYYHINEFDKFNKKFEELINDGIPKIYILDIELNGSESGMDIARKIRTNDWESIIIFITSHNEYGYDALKAHIMLLDFILKYTDYEKHLEQVIKKALNNVNRKKTVVFKSDGVSYIIHLEDILYITKDTNDRKSVIKTTYNKISVNKTLSCIKDNLDDRFCETHRSCIVNTNRISHIDWNSNVISFSNGDSIDLISRDKKKGLKEYVGS